MKIKLDYQVRHVSRLLATQLTSAGLGPGVMMAEEQRQRELAREDMEEVRIHSKFAKSLWHIRIYGTRSQL
jgi:hypothetical protein